MAMKMARSRSVIEEVSDWLFSTTETGDPDAQDGVDAENDAPDNTYLSVKQPESSTDCNHSERPLDSTRGENDPNAVFANFDIAEIDMKLERMRVRLATTFAGVVPRSKHPRNAKDLRANMDRFMQEFGTMSSARSDAVRHPSFAAPSLQFAANEEDNAVDEATAKDMACLQQVIETQPRVLRNYVQMKPTVGGLLKSFREQDRAMHGNIHELKLAGASSQKDVSSRRQP
eukprot:NODE_14694_length_1092_cov_5.531606.p1 GENE.NODE_14694_length_1092_cov_5.531606~~NODE_14694_length_1092_cov_5.531606.p1  ORF type:complete len:230 (-),score=33.22 NODE_14694_length_1092_cov_5.531606:305-994(-)